MNSNRGRFITVVGSHYSGKSTICSRLQKENKFIVLEEKWWEDPFRSLKPRDYFRSEIWFLLQSIQSHEKADALRKRGERVIMDTSLYSVDIFAQTKLSTKEYSVFHNLVNSIAASLSKPDLLVYLYAEPQFLHKVRREQRIASKTGPESDASATLPWIENISKLHEEYFRKWNRTPLMRINVEKTDIMKDSSIIKQIIGDV